MRSFSPIVLFFAGLISCFLFQQCRSTALNGEQSIYTYRNESVGYSDLKRLYTIDSLEDKKPFFSRRDLQTFKFNLNCDVKKTVVRANGKIKFTAFQVINPVLEIENGGFLANTTAISNELMHPVLAEMAEDGLISSVRIDLTISDMSADMLKDMISRLQFVRSRGNIDSWQLTEENVQGSYLAKYRLLQTDSLGALYEKTNGGYSKIRSSKSGQRILPENQTTILVNTTGIVEKINVSEAQVVLSKMDTITASGNRITVELKSGSKTGNEELAEISRLNAMENYKVRSTLSTGLSEEKIIHLAYTNTLENDNWETLKLKLQKAATANTDATREDSLVLKFRALAYLNPDACESMFAVLKQEPVGSFTYRVLINALSTTETPSAINVLAHLVKERRSEENLLMNLLPVFAITKSPTDEAVALVKELVTDTANSKAVISTAQLALGGLAYNYRELDQEKSDDLSRYILQKMAIEKDSLQKVLVLGNTGSFLAFPFLHSYINDTTVSTRIRVSAISALSLVKNKEVTRLLDGLLVNPDSLIIKAATKTINYRKGKLYDD